MTESKRLRHQFLQAQKMESVGRLAGGVAHDFNNLLTVMKGYLELALSTVHEEDPIREDLLEVEKAAESAAALTQQLLAFSRKQIIHPQVLNLNQIVLKVTAMLQRLLGEDIELRTSTAADLGWVRFDPGQAEQVLLNLAVNARDAMPHGGLLSLETSNVRVDEFHSGTPLKGETDQVESRDYVLLAVTDTGCGISEEVQAHMFEPFYTTKGPGSGTGLGLATIYGAVSQNDGRIEVVSQKDKGTTFKILLPRLPEPEPDAEAPDEATTALPRGCETIVLVEDDDALRTLAKRLLDRQGYKVMGFGDGPSALETVANLSEAIHVLITDVIMPGMNGRRLSEELKALRPSVRVLFTSGYTADIISPHGVFHEGLHFLAKPYSAWELAVRVREVLDAPRSCAP